MTQTRRMRHIVIGLRRLIGLNEKEFVRDDRNDAPAF